VTRHCYFVLALVFLAAWQSSAALAGESQQPEGEPAEMTGLYVYFADAALFTDCADGRRRPVAMEADNTALERAYGTAKHNDGRPLLVRVQGHYAQRPKMEGKGTEEVLVVDEFKEISGDAECSARADAAVLEIDWLLQEITGESFVEGTDLSRARIRLHRDGKVSGSNGCNRLTGGFELNGDRLTFGRIASTRRACPGDYMKLEAAFDTMLSKVQSWQLGGGRMLLLGSGGILATFVAAGRD
jgi:copper homeostasis protein (lipoprotein)